MEVSQGRAADEDVSAINLDHRHVAEEEQVENAGVDNIITPVEALHTEAVNTQPQETGTKPLLPS